MATLTRDQLVQNLQSMNNTVLGTVRTITEPTMNKTGNPFYGKVWKVQDLSASIGAWNYTKSVNARRLKEWKERLLSDPNEPQPAPFVPGDRVNGTERVPNSPFAKKGDQLYLELSVHSCLHQKFIDENGNEVSKTALEPFLRKSKPNTSQELDNEVILRTFKIENVVSITYGGVTVEVQEQQFYAPSKLVI